MKARAHIDPEFAIAIERLAKRIRDGKAERIQYELSPYNDGRDVVRIEIDFGPFEESDAVIP